MNNLVKKVFIKTFGCQMNVYDSGRIMDVLAGIGYAMTDKPENADVIVVNTCHIREKAADKIFSELGRYASLKKAKPDLIIVVAGCVVQALAEDFLLKAKFVDIALGPQSYHLLPLKLEMIARQRGQKIIDVNFMAQEKFDTLPEHSSCSAVSFLAIQEGCDRFCSYCVVPYTRGAEYSRALEDVMNEAKDMVRKGAKEIILLGQNVNAWHGIDNLGQVSCLEKLIVDLTKVKGLERIRFVTSYPSDMTDGLMRLFGQEEKLLPYLHLPVQSGSNKVLKLMNRRYSVELYLDIVAKLREIRSDIALSSDFIVGFAGESDEDFSDTMALIDKVRFASSFSFKYSPRAGTVGAAMKNQVPEKIKSERLMLLQEKLQKYQLEFNQNTLGKKMKILIETKGKKDKEFIGHSPYMQTVVLKNMNMDVTGQIMEVSISKAGLNGLEAVE